MRPPHSGGGVDAGGFEATAAAASTSNEAAEANTTDWSCVVGCIGSVTVTGGRPRWLCIYRRIA